MKKRPARYAVSTAAEFNFAARREFVRGASQRKEERRKEAQARALQKQKQERRVLRAERREKIQEHIRHVQTSQRLAAAAAASLPSKKQKAVGSLKLKGSSANIKIPNVCGASTEISSQAVSTVKEQVTDVVQAVRLVPAVSEASAAAPWLVGSCVSLSVGGFDQDSQGTPSAPVHLPQPKPETSPQQHKVAQGASVPSRISSVTPKWGAKVRGTRRVSRGGKKPSKKRHKSRKPQRKRGGCK